MMGVPVPWSTVMPGDRVYGADGCWWTCDERIGSRLTLTRPGRDPVRRIPPAGAVRCVRGPEGQALVRVAQVFVGAGLALEVISYE